VRWYERLRRQAEIAYIRRRGKRATASTFTAYLADLACGRPRVGITISKAVGKAVVRNRIRRRLRGALDGANPPLPGRCGLLLVVRPEAAPVSYERLVSDVTRMLEGYGSTFRRGG
jgi:ribonuclease P protein component